MEDVEADHTNIPKSAQPSVQNVMDVRKLDITSTCFTKKPSSLQTPQVEEDDAQDSDDPGERVFLGTLTAEHSIHVSKPTNEVNAIQSHRFGTAAILEMQLTSEPRN